MQCPQCPRECSAGAKFCEECGAGLKRACPACGGELSATAKFCAECGEQVAGPAAPEIAEPPRERSPRDYTPAHLSEKILRSRSALEGERKQLSVLFADVKSSLEVSEGLDPETWHHILDRFFQILSEGVHRFEGTVNQYSPAAAFLSTPASIRPRLMQSRGFNLGQRGRIDEGLRYVDHAIELAAEQGINETLGQSCSLRSTFIRVVGDSGRQLEDASRGYEIALQSGSNFALGPGASIMSTALAENDLADEAVEVMESALRHFEEWANRCSAESSLPA